MPERYRPEVIEHLVHPQGVGEVNQPDGCGEAGDAACGDVARFTLRVEDSRLSEVCYKVYGCAACVAAGSALVGLVRGRHLLEAARVSRADVEEVLGGPLPEGKEHALTLVIDALHRAFEDYLDHRADVLLGGGYTDGSAGEEGTVVAAMSGGVDSAVTALLLKEAGYRVATVTFRLHDGEPGSRSCCSPDTVLFARETAHRMGLPHFTLNLKRLFERRVLSDFVGSYAAGRTPNPCVACNAHVKFHAAAFLADMLGFRHIATGHYARVAETPYGPALARPKDERKDQTYVLWPVPEKLLRRTVFPLGDYEKSEVRAIAADRELAVAHTPESQDICFIPDGDYRRFVRERVTSGPGEVVDRSGRVLGRHEGIVNFTVGQRRGLGVSTSTPLYVTEVRPECRQVVVGRKRDLLVWEILVGETNWFMDPSEADSVQVRYNGSQLPCRIKREGESWLVRLEEPTMAVAPGQSAVFYAGERVVGGGVILRRGRG
mgnify:CR=1 FL=1